MSFASMRKEIGREPVIIVEIDLDYCVNTYGVAPCAAALGVTGAIKCFNTRKTCQDPTNYNKTSKTYRFSNVMLPSTAPAAIPSISDVQFDPTVIDPTQGLGTRAQVTVTLTDAPFADFGIDKYISERPYDSMARGTFWGKLLARNPYYQNRVMRVMTGYINNGVYDPANFVTRLYVLDRIDGPNDDDSVTITAKDVLKLVDDDRAQAPFPNTGVLAADITDVATTINLLPVGVGASEYASSGWVCLGTEVMSFTRVGDALTVVRAQYNTKADTHSAGDAVQQCLHYSAKPVADVLYELLTLYGSVPTSYIDKPAWDAEAALWLPTHNLSTLITKPTGINTLVTELTEQCLFYIWWDELQQAIPFRAIRPPEDTEIVAWTDDANILANSYQIEQDPAARISQVQVYWSQIDPTQSLDKLSNYFKGFVLADEDAQGTDEFGELRVKVIYSRWLPDNTNGPAQVLASRLIARFRNNPQKLTVRVDAKDADLWTAGVAEISNRHIQDPTGGPTTQIFQVISVQEVVPGTIFEYYLTDTFFQGRYIYIMDNSTPDYSAASPAQKRKGFFISPNNGVFADGTGAYKII